MGVRTALKPPSTPPFILLLFSVLHLVSALLDLIFHARFPGYTIYYANSARIAACVLIAYISGTYPLQRMLPGTNVAQPGDVRVKRPVTCPETYRFNSSLQKRGSLQKTA